MRKIDFILESKMAELNQNKKSKQPYSIDIAYSSKQLFIKVPQNCCTKSIGKFPKKVAHVSFLQCSANIALGQHDWLKKINLKVFWNYRVRRIR